MQLTLGHGSSGSLVNTPQHRLHFLPPRILQCGPFDVIVPDRFAVLSYSDQFSGSGIIHGFTVVQGRLAHICDAYSHSRDGYGGVCAAGEGEESEDGWGT
jgi:hypothetical protein